MLAGIRGDGTMAEELSLATDTSAGVKEELEEDMLVDAATDTNDQW